MEELKMKNASLLRDIKRNPPVNVTKIANNRKCNKIAHKCNIYTGRC